MGTQLWIRTLNFARDLEFFISLGICPIVLNLIEDAVSMLHLSVPNMLQLHSDWFLRLYCTPGNSKKLFISSGAILALISKFSVISFYRFRRCKVVELSLLWSSSKDESKSLYTTRKTLSWNIHTTG